MDKNDKIRLNAIKKRWLGRKRFGQYQKGLAEFGSYRDVATLISMVEKYNDKIHDFDNVESSKGPIA